MLSTEKLRTACYLFNGVTAHKRSLTYKLILSGIITVNVWMVS